jgi:hypothetical protein
LLPPWQATLSTPLIACSHAPLITCHTPSLASLSFSRYLCFLVRLQVTPEAIASLKRTGCGIKGEFVTGVGKGTLPSINIELRKSMKVRGRRRDAG